MRHQISSKKQKGYMRNCPLKRVNNSLRKVKYCYGNFLLVETEVVMTTLTDIFTRER